jgi:hypothetical protein
MLGDYHAIYEELLALYERSRINFSGLGGLRSAGKVFGVDLEVPEHNARRAAENYFLNVARKHRLEQERMERAERPAGSGLLNLFGRQSAEGPPPVVHQSAALVIPPPPMPRIRDIVLAKLKEAGQNGLRAKMIRDFIQETFKRDIHEKTVGMTLYRLSQDNLAYRVGITWFFGPAPPDAKNPGVTAPGL